MKYRGKQTIDDHHWYYGDLIYTLFAAYIIEQSDKGEYHSIKVVPETVTKCIDYVDINGDDIYEGDIINIRKTRLFDVYSLKEGEEICVVESKYDFLCKLTKDEHRAVWNIVEILGNKWDNPHVLELCKKEIRNDSNDSSRTGETEEVAS